MKKIGTIIWEIVEIIAAMMGFALAAIYVMEFITGMFWGGMSSDTALIGVMLAVGITSAVTEVRHRKKSEAKAKEYYENYKVKVTAAAMLFVAEGKLTSRELNRFLSILRYTARKNKWEERAETEKEDE